VSLPPSIGRYEIVGQLAIGGMAEILLGRIRGPSGFDRPVVVKRILPHLARRKQFEAMFLDEARIVAGIRHPNVVFVHELGREAEDLFLVLEYLEGESAANLVRGVVCAGRILDHRLAAYVLAEACAGLHAAHELTNADGALQGLVHRDVSPQNLFVTYSGQVKVLDFGIATAADRVARTEAGQVKGKFEYMSPEQCMGRPLDRRSDVFSLGAVLYELSTGRRLFKRTTELATLRAITTEPIVPPSRIVERYPARLEAVCLRALAKAVDERYATAAEMRRDLLAVVRELEVGADGDEPATALARLMHELFSNRAADKKEMLRRVRAGSNVTHVPSDDADDVPDLPSVVDEPGTEAGSARDQPPAARSKPTRTPWILAAVAGAAAVAALALATTRTSEVPAPSPVAVSAATPPDSTPAPSTAPAAAREVILHVESKPSGARVLVGGAEQGVTPTDIPLLRADEPVVLVLQRQGFAALEQTVVPNENKGLVLVLEPAPRPARRPAAPPAGAPSAAAPPVPTFRRFN